MLLEKLKELNISFNVNEIICDFELNIHKSIDEVIPEAEIWGCFFHQSKAFKEKVDKKGMRSVYDNDYEFRKFVKQPTGLSSLPLEDVELGFKWLEENTDFEDEKKDKFKEEHVRN